MPLVIQKVYPSVIKNERFKILINLHLNEYTQELYWCLFVVKLDRCVGSCNAFNDFRNKICVPNQT